MRWTPMTVLFVALLATACATESVTVDAAIPAEEPDGTAAKSAQEPPSPTPEPTVVVEPTAVPEPPPTPTPTVAPVPTTPPPPTPTPTPLPPTPTPTPEPVDIDLRPLLRLNESNPTFGPNSTVTIVFERDGLVPTLGIDARVNGGIAEDARAEAEARLRSLEIFPRPGRYVLSYRVSWQGSTFEPGGLIDDVAVRAVIVVNAQVSDQSVAGPELDVVAERGVTTDYLSSVHGTVEATAQVGHIVAFQVILSCDVETGGFVASPAFCDFVPGSFGGVRVEELRLQSID